MARENQGLQIALIIFFMLTIILGVTTFVFFRQYQEADKKAEAARASLATKTNAADVLADQIVKLEKYLGVVGLQPDEVDGQYNQDIADYGATYPETDRDYHKLTMHLFNTIQGQNVELAGLKTEAQRWKDKFEVVAASRDLQVQQFQDQAEDAAKSAAVEIASARNEDARINAEKDTLAADFKKKKDEHEVVLAATKADLETAFGNIDKLEIVNHKKTEALNELRQETIDVPDGEIVFVNQHNQTVWITVGRADGLPRQITLAVYPADTSNLTKASKKASIEVTQILGENLAEARVLEDTISDPIVRGDKIHTPLWSPGEQRQFALAGFFDVDDDGKSDQQLIRNLIEMNGGLVVCSIDEQGELDGKIDENTRYLVLGRRPTHAKSDAAVRDPFSKMVGDAKESGVQTIQMGDLLQQMGWKNRTPVTRYGRGANPNDFKPQPPDGIPKVSTGTVSELFRPRRPPPVKRSGRGGAY